MKPPYRALSFRPVEAPVPARTKEEQLGPVVREFRPAPLEKALRLPGVVCTVLFVMPLVLVRDPWILVLATPLALGLFLWLAHTPFSLRNLRVLLHQGGVVVQRGPKRDAFLFDDVDEVWMEGERKNGILMLAATKLVARDGTSHRVPLAVESPVDLYNTINRYCSQPLVADALHAVDAGETLTFGPAIMIDGKEIDVGGGRRALFSELSLVRFSSGQIKLFRGSGLFAWCTLDLRTVPHPIVLIHVLKKLAPVSEDEDTPALRGGES